MGWCAVKFIFQEPVINPLVPLGTYLVVITFFISQEKPKSPKARVDAEFFNQLRQLLVVGIPGVFSKEAAYVFLIAGSLVARSLCDLWLIHTGTLIETLVFGIFDY